MPRLRSLPVAFLILAGLVTGRVDAQPVPVTTQAEMPSPATERRLAQPASAPGEANIGPMKFPDLTVDAALERLEAWSGRTVLRPAGLPAASISFSLNHKVTREEACRIMESVLALNGIAVTPLGDKLLKVMPLNTARTEAPDFIEGSTLELPPSGHVASKLFQLKFLRASKFAPQISGLLNAGAASAPMVFEKTNSMLLTDTVANLQRVETLMTQLDQPALEGLTPKFFRVQNSTASALVTKLQSLLTGASATSIGSSTVYQADDRTNQIILLSDPRQHPFFEQLITQLDMPGESSTRQEVIPLKHATATQVAELLSSLISGQNSASSRNGAAQSTSQQLTAARNAALAAVNQANNLAHQAAAQAAQANANRPANAQVASPANNTASGLIFNAGGAPG